MKSISELTEEEKSLMLAELAGWVIACNNPLLVESKSLGYKVLYEDEVCELVPYKGGDEDGLAQAHAIFLKFPEVMYSDRTADNGNIIWNEIQPTQSNINDEILIMQNKAKR